MNIKDELLKIKDKISKTIEGTNDRDKQLSSDEELTAALECDLDYKVDSFLSWYSKAQKANYDCIGDYESSTELRNLIEKMAVWYELRYPDYEMSTLFTKENDKQDRISELMFQRNQYVRDNVSCDSEIKKLDWSKFYNSQVFFDSLDNYELFYFVKPRYQDIVYWDNRHSFSHLHLSEDGTVMMAEEMGRIAPGITDNELEGKSLKEVVEILKAKNIEFPENNELEKAITEYDNWSYQREEMLNCVMYRIISRGGNRSGPIRAFLFAKEFGRNIEIPMMYVVDKTDPNLRRFMNEYLKAGGSKELNCYLDYFSRIDKEKEPDNVSVQELITSTSDSCSNFYTPEENELHQSLVNILANQVEYKKKEEAKVKKLRLENNN